MNTRKLVAWNLRRLRVASGLSQEALGTDSGVDRAYVGRLERGEENPTIALLDRLSAALHVHVSQLFVEPRSGDAAPRPMKGGRRPSVTKRKTTKRRVV